MALPIAIAAITAAATVVQGAMSYASQSNAADAARSAAVLAAESDLAALDRKAKEINTSAAFATVQRIRQSKKYESAITASQGNSGVTGNSLLREMFNTMVQSKYDEGVIETQRQMSHAQITTEREKVAANESGRLNMAETGVSGGAAAISTGLSAAANSISAYASMK